MFCFSSSLCHSHYRLHPFFLHSPVYLISLLKFLLFPSLMLFFFYLNLQRFSFNLLLLLLLRLPLLLLLLLLLLLFSSLFTTYSFIFSTLNSSANAVSSLRSEMTQRTVHSGSEWDIQITQYRAHGKYFLTVIMKCRLQIL